MKRLLATALSVSLAACAQAQSDLPFDVEIITDFHEPWAMDFLPDGRMQVRVGDQLFAGQPVGAKAA